MLERPEPRGKVCREVLVQLHLDVKERVVDVFVRRDRRDVSKRRFRAFRVVRLFVPLNVDRKGEEGPRQRADEVVREEGDVLRIEGNPLSGPKVGGDGVHVPVPREGAGTQEERPTVERPDLVRHPLFVRVAILDPLDRPAEESERRPRTIPTQETFRPVQQEPGHLVLNARKRPAGTHRTLPLKTKRMGSR